MEQGFYAVLEGADGSGKTSIMRLVANQLAHRLVSMGVLTTEEAANTIVHKVYEIVATKGDWTIMPARGEWDIIHQYLTQLTQSSISQPKTI